MRYLLLLLVVVAGCSKPVELKTAKGFIEHAKAKGFEFKDVMPTAANFDDMRAGYSIRFIDNEFRGCYVWEFDGKAPTESLNGDPHVTNGNLALTVNYRDESRDAAQLEKVFLEY